MRTPVKIKRKKRKSLGKVIHPGIMKKLRKKKVKEAYKESKFRESGDFSNNLSLLRSSERLKHIRGLEVLNVESNQIETL